MHFSPLRLFRCFTPTGAKIHFESLPKTYYKCKTHFVFFVKFTQKIINVCYDKNDFLTVQKVNMCSNLTCISSWAIINNLSSSLKLAR